MLVPVGRKLKREHDWFGSRARSNMKRQARLSQRILVGTLFQHEHFNQRVLELVGDPLLRERAKGEVSSKQLQEAGMNCVTPAFTHDEDCNIRKIGDQSEDGTSSVDCVQQRKAEFIPLLPATWYLLSSVRRLQHRRLSAVDCRSETRGTHSLDGECSMFRHSTSMCTQPGMEAWP